MEMNSPDYYNFLAIFFFFFWKWKCESSTFVLFQDCLALLSPSTSIWNLEAFFYKEVNGRFDRDCIVSVDQLRSIVILTISSITIDEHEKSFHLFRSSSTMFYNLQNIGSALLVEVFLVLYSFHTIVDRISLISHLDCCLLVYTCILIKYIPCILILYLTTLLNWLVR